MEQAIAPMFTDLCRAMTLFFTLYVMIYLSSLYLPGDLTVSKRTGTSNRIEIQFRTFNPLSRPDSFVKLFETLCLCLAQGNECLGQI